MKKSQLIKLVNELLIEDFLGEEYVKGRPPQDWEERDWELFDENYADGKVKGKSRPGRVKRSGASCKG